MAKAPDDTPEPIQSAVNDLFSYGFRSHRTAVASRRFHRLVQSCIDTYSAIAISRLPGVPEQNFNAKRHRDALERFFQWTGAPWFEGKLPTAKHVANRLHRAYLNDRIERTYMVPLDDFDPEEHPHPQDGRKIERFTFGPCSIERLDREGLSHHVPIAALKRFERWHNFPEERLKNFCWLIVRAQEPAGPPWRGDGFDFLDRTWDAIGHSPLYDPAFPEPVERALFVVLLSIDPGRRAFFWEPFATPWIYQFTDDPFQRPPRAPDPDRLTWEIIGEDEFKVPAHRRELGVKPQTFQRNLRERWRLLEAALSRDGTRYPVLNPLTKHFYVKAFTEDAIDQLLMNLSCLEATFTLRGENRSAMNKRLKRMTGLKTIADSVDKAYKIRNKYIHSLGRQAETISWKDFAEIRWATNKAIYSYLRCAHKRLNLTRSQLVKLFGT